MINNFTKSLITWNNNQNQRQMPWKGETDAYKIWLSEIILQQTRVEQGTAYYQKFVKAFPTIIDLAKANETIIMKMWEGLGYYSRCRNLITTAQFVAAHCNGIFPDNYNEILKLKGVGPYTAAAIASFAFNLPYAVLDGNVYRVLSRFTGNATPIDSTEGKAYFSQLSQQFLDKKNPGTYNQAIMDFGATVCKPKQPLCSSCPLQKNCIAYKTNSINELPVKAKKLQIKKRFFHYFIIQTQNEILIQKRNDKDVWRDLYQFYLLETDENTFDNDNDIVKVFCKTNNINLKQVTKVTKLYQQKLTHQIISAKFHEVQLKEKSRFLEYVWVKKTKLPDYPFAAIINLMFSHKKTENMI